jgi:hypothetical protein
VLGHCTFLVFRRVAYTVCVYMDWFTFFGDIIGPAIGQVPRLLICSLSVSFPLPWFSGGVVISSCWLCYDVALYYRGLSSCVLIDLCGSTHPAGS